MWKESDFGSPACYDNPLETTASQAIRPSLQTGKKHPLSERLASLDIMGEQFIPPQYDSAVMVR